MGILKFFDDLFCAIEGSTNGTIAGVKPAEEEQTLGAIADFIFSLKSDKNQALDGVYLDNKEKFKTELLKELNGFATDLQWQKPWKPAYFVDTEKGRITTYRPMNIRGEAYIPINAVLLKPGFYITPKELTKRGGRVNNNTFPYYIGHFFYVEIEEEKTTVENGEKVSTIETRKVPRMRGSKVFNTEDVICDNVPRFRDLKKYHYEDNELNEFIENFITKLKDLKRIPKLFFDQVDKCFFIPSKDEIHLVDFRNFEKMDEYYSTLLHEVIHSTLLRKKDGKPVRNGFEDKYKLVSYACEELVAEMGAYILCSELGLSYTKQNSLAYLKNWEGFAKEIRDDILLEAYGQACQAVDFLVEDIDFKALIPNEIIKKVKAEAKKEKPKEKPKATEEKPKAEPKEEPKPKATEEKPKEEPKEEPKPTKEEKPKEEPEPLIKYYPINEDLAEQYHNTITNAPYIKGTATNAYKEKINSIYKTANSAPDITRDMALKQARTYSQLYADYINKYNEIGCTIKNKEEQIKAFEALKTESKKIDSLEFIIEDLRHGRDKKEEPKSELDELVDKAKKDFEDLSKL